MRFPLLQGNDHIFLWWRRWFITVDFVMLFIWWVLPEVHNFLLWWKKRNYLSVIQEQFREILTDSGFVIFLHGEIGTSFADGRDHSLHRAYCGCCIYHLIDMLEFTRQCPLQKKEIMLWLWIMSSCLHVILCLSVMETSMIQREILLCVDCLIFACFLILRFFLFSHGSYD